MLTQFHHCANEMEVYVYDNRSLAQNRSNAQLIIQMIGDQDPNGQIK